MLSVCFPLVKRNPRNIMVLLLSVVFSGVQLTGMVLISEMCNMNPEVIPHFRRVRGIVVNLKLIQLVFVSKFSVALTI